MPLCHRPVSVLGVVGERHRHEWQLRHWGRREEFFVFRDPLSTIPSFRGAASAASPGMTVREWAAHRTNPPLAPTKAMTS
ncbi:hypothetical protein BJA5080_06681 [Bradyrhizobium diazoefficiens SEMIA 5080]|uniref:Uncharacterized protein n=1 Tax=Bradyrhizobium diazoefficiens SEMIA 5080 TaxID=754504 RepID=A0A837CMZ2_9BRAD|nr:hypothetical protein BJA5080_06681 [Bradyrhizobium diazoefficiens SEMIA 5080]